MFHYFRKADIVESAIGGAMVIALCGEKIVVTKAAKPDSPVCPECREIFDQMKRG